MRYVLIVLTLLSLLAVAPAQYGHGATKPAADQLPALKKAYTNAKAAYTKAPKDAAKKKSYVAATVKLGTASMMSDSLDRKVKYKLALQYYREALKLDPKNPEAKQNSEMIIAIYKQMGRPIPN